MILRCWCLLFCSLLAVFLLCVFSNIKFFTTVVFSDLSICWLTLNYIMHGTFSYSDSNLLFVKVVKVKAERDRFCQKFWWQWLGKLSSIRYLRVLPTQDWRVYWYSNHKWLRLLHNAGFKILCEIIPRRTAWCCHSISYCIWMSVNMSITCDLNKGHIYSCIMIVHLWAC